MYYTRSRSVLKPELMFAYPRPPLLVGVFLCNTMYKYVPFMH